MNLNYTVNAWKCKGIGTNSALETTKPHDIRGIKSRHTDAENKYAQADKNVMGQAQSFSLKAPQKERLINNFNSNMTSLISVR